MAGSFLSKEILASHRGVYSMELMSSVFFFLVGEGGIFV
jgi:hypothetical protein